MRFSVIVAIALIHRKPRRLRWNGHVELTVPSVLLVAAATYVPRTDADTESVNDVVETNAESLEARSRVRPGTVFVTGECTNDRDCATGCCGFITGRCASAPVAIKQDGGCGFGGSRSRRPGRRPRATEQLLDAYL